MGSRRKKMFYMYDEEWYDQRCVKVAWRWKCFKYLFFINALRRSKTQFLERLKKFNHRFCYLVTWVKELRSFFHRAISRRQRYGHIFLHVIFCFSRWKDFLLPLSLTDSLMGVVLACGMKEMPSGGRKGRRNVLYPRLFFQPLILYFYLLLLCFS